MKPMQSKRERNPSPAGQPPRVGMLRPLGNISDTFIRAALLVTLASFSVQSWGEPLGRLFSTPDERADLERARLTGDSTEQKDAPARQQESLTLNGIVKRSSGKITVWVNHAVLDETHFPPDTKIQARKSRPPEFPVLVQKTGKTVTLKVGQTLIIDSGEIRESYQPPAIKAPSAAAETGGTEKISNS